MWLWGVQDDISNHRIRYTKQQIVDRLEKAGFTVERATYANWTFFAPILGGRTLMKLTGINQLWVADITFVRLQQEFVYLAVCNESRRSTRAKAFR